MNAVVANLLAVVLAVVLTSFFVCLLLSSQMRGSCIVLFSSFMWFAVSPFVCFDHI